MALHEQVRFLRQACTNGAALAIEGSLDEVLQLNNGAIHLRTTLSQFEFITLWDQFSSLNFELACRHPWANWPAATHKTLRKNHVAWAAPLVESPQHGYPTSFSQT